MGSKSLLSTKCRRYDIVFHQYSTPLASQGYRKLDLSADFTDFHRLKICGICEICGLSGVCESSLRLAYLENAMALLAPPYQQISPFLPPPPDRQPPEW
jgi:hypothetical protein